MNSRTVDILNAGRARPNTPVALRRAVVPVTGVALLLAALLGAGQPGTPTPTAVNVASQSSVGPHLLVPQQARPGARLTVLVHRDHRLCGNAELRLDGFPVQHRVLADLGPVSGQWQALIMTMDVPGTAAPGRHVVRLDGPIPGGRGGLLCAEMPEHQDRIAEATLVLAGQVPAARRPGPS
jgi:hypothetical protein